MVSAERIRNVAVPEAGTGVFMWTRPEYKGTGSWGRFAAVVSGLQDTGVWVQLKAP